MTDWVPGDPFEHKFTLEPGPMRDGVLAAAGTLHLRVHHYDAERFSVWTTSSEETVQFGVETGREWQRREIAAPR